MTRKKLDSFLIIFILSLGLNLKCAECVISFGDVLDVVQVGKDIVVAVSKSWNLIDDHFDVAEVPLPIVSKRERTLLNRMNVINGNIQKLYYEVEGIGTQTITAIMKTLPEQIKFDMKLNDLLDYVTRIDVYYTRMQYYTKNNNNNNNNNRQIERLTLEDFAKSAISHDSSSVQSLIERIHAFFVPQRAGVVDTGIIKPLLNVILEIDGGVQCSLKESPQQMLLNLYNTIALTELKGYAMIQFSYMLLKLYGQGNFTKEADIMKERYLMRSSQSIEATKDALKLASRELWICDPKKFVKDKNYLEVTELLQGYVQNEVDLNSDGTCRENCAEYKYTKSHGCFQNLYCHQQRRCYGKIMNCQFIDADAWICPAASGSNRRYEYIEYENGRVLGRKKACHRGTTKVDSWWRWLFWHCSYCVCICDEQGTNSDRYFNLQESLSDIENNKVVTGLRFTKDNRIIHLQVQQGRLLTKGKIEKDSTEWVPVNSYKITDVGIKNEQHYHTLTWEKRAFDLDDLSGDSGELLTGVRFKLIGSHLNFEIRLTPFDFVTGQLLPEKSYWKDNINTDASRFNPRKKLNLENRDIPINTQSPSVPDSQNDQYFEFTHTDLERDVAQTTVPFIDSQNVASTVPVPLSGAGIYHKGLPSFGGFIAPKIFTYNFGEVLENALNDIEMNPDVAVNK